MNDTNIKCDHVWRSVGLWDGKTPDGSPTGGLMYMCDKCKDRAHTKDEIKTKGGTIVEGTDLFGKPLSTI